MKQPIFNIKLYCGSRMVTKPDGTVANYGLDFVAGSEELAKEICEIHGMQYDGELVSIIDDNNGGEKVTLYDKDGDTTTDFETPPDEEPKGTP